MSHSLHKETVPLVFLCRSQSPPEFTDILKAPEEAVETADTQERVPESFLPLQMKDVSSLGLPDESLGYKLSLLGVLL